MCIRNFLSLNFRVFLTKTLYQFAKDSFVAPSVSVIKNFHMFQKNSVYPKTFKRLLKQLSTVDFYILTKYMTLSNKKSLQKSLFIQQKNLSSLTRDCSLTIFTANKTITNLTQYELSQDKADLLKAGLYLSIQPDKIQKSEIFTTFEEIHRSFSNNLKSKETKSQIKTHLSHLANSYFYNYKLSPDILRQHRVFRNLRKNKNIAITKPDKGNEVVMLDLNFTVMLFKK